MLNTHLFVLNEVFDSKYIPDDLPAILNFNGQEFKMLGWSEGYSSYFWVEMSIVYTSLSANYGAETVTITELGYQENAGYLTSFVIKNLPVDAGEITIELTPYYIRSGSTEKVYQNSFTQLFTLNDGISA